MNKEALHLDRDIDIKAINQLSADLELNLVELSLFYECLIDKFEARPEADNELARAWLIGTMRNRLNAAISRLLSPEEKAHENDG